LASSLRGELGDRYELVCGATAQSDAPLAMLLCGREASDLPGLRRHYPHTALLMLADEPEPPEVLAGWLQAGADSALDQLDARLIAAQICAFKRQARMPAAPAQVCA